MKKDKIDQFIENLKKNRQLQSEFKKDPVETLKAHDIDPKNIPNKLAQFLTGGMLATAPAADLPPDLPPDVLALLKNYADDNLT